ncbi:hypothetical protein [Desulfuromonas carbonis]
MIRSILQQHRSLVALCLSGLLLAWGGAARAAEGPPPGAEVVWELDAYYSNVGLFLPLTQAPIPDLAEQSEAAIYRHLLLTSWPPRFALVELSLNPMPILGVYLKKHQRSFYDQTDFDGFNLVESVTAGFQEPYAATLFFGNVATFVRRGESRLETNKGYMGYLFSVGSQHIKDNVMIDDRWLEAEWKLKGDRNFEDLSHHWSFRLGAKLHENSGIADFAYIGLRRSLLDFQGAIFSWLENSEINLKTDFSLADGRFLGQEVVVGKKFPLRGAKLALSLDFGCIWQSASRYAERYREPEDQSFTVVLRPNIEF